MGRYTVLTEQIMLSSPREADTIGPETDSASMKRRSTLIPVHPSRNSNATLLFSLGAVGTMCLGLLGCQTITTDWEDGFANERIAHEDESDIKVTEGIIHIVADGERLVAISRTYQVSLERLQRINRIPDPDKIFPGQRLRIPGAKQAIRVAEAPPVQTGPNDRAKKPTPTPRKVYHVVKQGESLYLIARTYDLSIRQLARVNNIANDRVLTEGQKLLIPGATKALAVVLPTPTPVPKDAPTPTPTPVSIDPATGKERTNVQLPTKKFGTIELAWPLAENFRIARKFKPRGAVASYGIDLEASEGTPVYAAADGDVFLVGTPSDDLLGSSSGNYIIIFHGKVDGKGVRTIYAQNKENLVKAGQKVNRGDLIARVGKSGRGTPGVSGPFLHFELRRVETALDPLKYLVKRQ